MAFPSRGGGEVLSFNVVQVGGARLGLKEVCCGGSERRCRRLEKGSENLSDSCPVRIACVQTARIQSCG